MKNYMVVPTMAVLALLAVPAKAVSFEQWLEPGGQHTPSPSMQLSLQPSLTGLDTTGFWSLLAGLDSGEIPEMIVTAPRPEQPWDEIMWTLWQLETIAAQTAADYFGNSEQAAIQEPSRLSEGLAECLHAADSQLASCLRNARINNAGCLGATGLVPHVGGRLIAVAVCTGLYEWEHYRCNETSRRARERCSTTWS